MTNCWRWMGAAVVTGAALGLAQDTAPSQVPATNIKVVKFAESHKGKQVGNGECWTLAAEALAAAGAPRPGADGVDVFDFGRKLTAKETPLPGDIGQMTKAVFTRKDPAGREKPVVTTVPQHTVVVLTVEGRKVAVLHQNFNGNRTVHRGEFDLAELTEGKVEFFRPRGPSVRGAGN